MTGGPILWRGLDATLLEHWLRLVTGGFQLWWITEEALSVVQNLPDAGYVVG